MGSMLIAGKKGDGKTLHVITHIIAPALKRKRKVYTNIEGVEARAANWAEYLGVLEIDILDLLHEVQDVAELKSLCQAEFSGVGSARFNAPAGALIVIDECHLIFKNDWYKTGGSERDLFKSFMSLERHNGNDIVFISQRPEAADVYIKTLCNEYANINNFQNILPIKGRYNFNKYDLFEDLNVRRGAISSSMMSFDKRCFRLYKSASLHVDKRGMGIIKWWWFLLFALFVFYMAKNLPKFSWLSHKKTTEGAIPTTSVSQTSLIGQARPIASDYTRDYKPDYKDVVIETPKTRKECKKYFVQSDCEKSGCIWGTGKMDFDGQMDYYSGCTSAALQVSGLTPVLRPPVAGPTADIGLKS